MNDAEPHDREAAPAAPSAERAVRHVLSTLDAVLSQRHGSVNAVARSCGIPATTGHRLLRAMEARGFVARDSSGAFIRGPEAARLGLRAWGLGRLALAVEPVLHQLRHETQLSAFVGTIGDGALWLGPYSLGRGSRTAVPNLSGRYRFDEAQPLDDLFEMSLYAAQGGAAGGTAQVAALAALPHHVGNGNALVGVLATQRVLASDPTLRDALVRARERLMAAHDGDLPDD